MEQNPLTEVRIYAAHNIALGLPAPAVSQELQAYIVRVYVRTTAWKEKLNFTSTEYIESVRTMVLRRSCTLLEQQHAAAGTAAAAAMTAA